MTLYLVRWPDLSCSLVKAHSRPELLDILDEIGSTESVEIWEYDGPVFVDFTLPTDRPHMISQAALDRDPSVPLTSDDVDVGDVSNIAAFEPPRVVVAEGDTGSDMWEAMLQIAFPHLYQVLYDNDDPDLTPDAVPVDQVEAAVKKEAELALKASWRWANVLKSDDPVAIMAAQLGASVEHVRNLQQAAEERAAAAGASEGPSQGVPPPSHEPEVEATCSFCGTSTGTVASIVTGPFCGICETCTRRACAILGVPLADEEW